MSVINKNLLKKFECSFFKLSLVFLFFIFIFGYSPISKKAYAYDIYYIEDLYNIRYDLSGNHVLLFDLDFNDPASYSNPANMISYTTGEGWDPIGSSGSEFSGTFDGNGHTISNLYINNTTDSEAGLFGRTYASTISDIGIMDAVVTTTSQTDYTGILVGFNSGVIENSYSTGSVTVVNAVGGLVGNNDGSINNSYSTGSVTGVNDVGGLVGINDASINNSYSTGSVTASGDNAGGLVGNNQLTGRIDFSFSITSVNGYTSVGGLVGQNSGIIEDSYSQGSVSGTNDWVGGLVGDNISSGSVINTYSTGSVNGSGIVGGLISANNGFVSDSYWDTETSGMGTSDGGTGKTTLEMHAIATFTNWDIVDISVFNMLSPSDWYIDEGNDYPRLFWEFEVSFEPVEPPPEVDYTIDSIEDLNNIRYDLAGDYVLTKDLDFNSDASYSDPANKIAYTTGEGWDPIGIFGAGSWFSGNFDGDGYIISNLYINNTTDEDVGLFGVAYYSNISNIGIVNANITSTSYAGILVSYYIGTGIIEDSYSTGSVTGSYEIGGLVSYNLGSINNSYSTANVTGHSGLGGLVGYNEGSINNSYSRGSLSGHDSYGGLVGENNGSITNSYSTGVIESPENTGGLVGINGDAVGTVTDSFWDTETSGIDVSDGGTGKTTVEMMSLLTFDISAPDENPSPWDIVKIENFDEEDPNTWYIDEGNDYPRLFWEFDGYTPPEDPQDPEDPENPETPSNRVVFHPDKRCHWDKPKSPNWIKLEPMVKDGVSGMNLTWVQYDADKINIKIDDGTGKYPWKIEKTSNDGHEFLPNVSSWQNIMIEPINHCKEGEYSLAVSHLAYPYGWYGQSGNKVALNTNTLGYSTKSAVLGTSTESEEIVSEETPSEETPMVPETGSSDILYLTTSLSIIGFSIYFVLNEKSRRFALRDFERRISQGL